MRGIAFGFLMTLLLLFVASSAWSQRIPFYAEPALSVGKQLKGRFSVNAKFVFRQQFASINEQQLDWFSQSDVVEVQLFLNYKILGSKRLTFGYLYGLDDPFLTDPAWEHRLMQQFTFQSGNRFKWVNRLRLEQRFSANQFRNRIRYRFTFDSPLSGSKLDPKEWYFVAGDEWLYNFTGKPGEDHLENRIQAGLGYLFDNGHKVQFEIQYRWLRMLSSREASAWHLLLTYNLNL
ncbi:MAG: DUF2490 domain-containing protein [Bacteroidetes bacterium]|nr:DUF2490 domain-containing protein [Bacteroidota bacterium]MBU1580184.1 DUF2490 domain-containing protein [Bacteroidota bacterium]MBU2558002.1 DUF2490 domain-containing protein [Bacteroidota bacterium]